MAKRFTDTEKWGDPWYRKLTTLQRSVWQYLCDKCDNAGYWKKDYEQMQFFIGESFDIESTIKILNNCKGRIKDHGDFLELTDFVSFQFGSLSHECKAHTHIFALKEKYASKGYPMGIHTHKDKDKDKDKDISFKGGVGERPSKDEVVCYFSELGSPGDAEHFFDHFTANGWRIGGKTPMKDWKAACRNWLRSPYRSKTKTSTQKFKDGCEKDMKDLNEWEEMKNGKKDFGTSNKLLETGIPSTRA